MRTIIAIDPGKSGGVAVSVLGVADCRPMPRTPGDVLALLRCIKAGSDRSGAETVCVLEKVNGFVGKAQPGSAMFKFGEGYGFLMGVVQALGIKLVLVRPQDWQKEFGLGTASRCASQSEWKNKLKAEAQRRFPHVTVTHKTADALLILEWGMGRERTDGTDATAHLGHTSSGLQPPSPQRGEGNLPDRVGESDRAQGWLQGKGGRPGGPSLPENGFGKVADQASTTARESRALPEAENKQESAL